MDTYLAVETSCPSCRSGRSCEPLGFSQPDVPVQSCTVAPTAQQAYAVPRGVIDLVICPACGLIYNHCFDPATQRFTPEYEETQGFSPTFRAFAEQLAEELVQRWKPTGCRILEIGCGKGDFLEMLCRSGGCRGLGIDPAFDPWRRPQGGAAEVRYEQRLFGSGDIGIRADYLVCRHTLEHIASVHEFLETIRQCCIAGGIREIFIEVPEAGRILDEGAFWDIYYEHANYFTEASLTRAMRASGFEVTGHQRLFNGQYLGIFAKPMARGLERPDPAPPMPMTATRLRNNRSEWRRFLDRTTPPVAIWGSGSKGVAFLSHMDPGNRIVAAVDINPYRQGKFMPGTGLPIIAPNALSNIRPTTVVIMNPAYRQEIAGQLREFSLFPGLTTV